MKLNLGCGEQRHPGYLNVDNCGTPDCHCDLSTFPWPWKSESVTEVRADHFLEHVVDYEATILEIHRILRPAGLFWARVPHFRSPLAIWHLHRWSFSTYTPLFLCESRAYQWDGRHLFDAVELRINYPFTHNRRLINRLVCSLFRALANRAPHHWDWLGLPIDEVEFKVRKR